jgi:hypothetical protein
MSNRKRALPALAARLGYVVTNTKRGHLKCRLPSDSVVFLAATPSDHRAIHNAAAMASPRAPSRAAGRGHAMTRKPVAPVYRVLWLDPDTPGTPWRRREFSTLDAAHDCCASLRRLFGSQCRACVRVPRRKPGPRPAQGDFADVDPATWPLQIKC